MCVPKQNVELADVVANVDVAILVGNVDLAKNLSEI